MELKSQIPNSKFQILRKQLGRIGVLLGGPSSEREISLKSGHAVLNALREQRLEAVEIDIRTTNVEENIRLIKSYNIDCAFIALHGYFGEDGQIQEILEKLKIPYTGSGVLASKLAMNKIASRKIWQENGLNVPSYIVIKKSFYNDFIEYPNLKLPWVVKPSSHGSSIGLSIVDNKQDLKKAIDLAFSFDETIIIEEYIKGRELTVGILDDEPLPIIEIVPKKRFFDYEAKYQTGLTDYIVPARLEEDLAKKIQNDALSAHQLLGCVDFSRVDMILREDNTVFILELNSIPGLTNTSLLPKAAKVAGIEFNQLCLKIISLAYEKVKNSLNV